MPERASDRDGHAAQGPPGISRRAIDRASLKEIGQPWAGLLD